MGIGPALNLGNWLYFVAVHVMANSAENESTKLRVLEAVNRTLIQCHNGQALDLGLKVSSLEQARIFELVKTTTQLKTGALTSLSMRLGGLYLQKGDRFDHSVTELGEALGVALQMYDDLSGIVNPKKYHKA